MADQYIISKAADERHAAAWQATNIVTDASGGQGRVSLEVALVGLLKAWELYAHAYELQFKSKIANDGYTGDYWLDIGKAIRGLFSSEFGKRLDAGSLDRRLLAHMEANGVDLTKEGL